MKNLIKFLVVVMVLTAHAAPLSIPDRQRGEGPFERLILRGVIIVNGEGAPPVGPMDVLIEGNRIVEIRNLGLYKPVPESNRIPVQSGDRVMELDGHSARSFWWGCTGCTRRIRGQAVAGTRYHHHS
jgi:hypothetical protein